MQGFVKVRLLSLLGRTKVSHVKEAVNESNSKVLIMSPHYDDDVLSCFGAITNHYSEKSEIHILYLTDGTESLESGLQPEELSKVRKEEAKNAVELYFQNIRLIHYNKKDGAFQVNEEDIKEFSELLMQEKYEYVYCPHPDDTHSDHKQTYKLLAEGLKRSRLHCKVRLYEFWLPLKNPNIFIDITKEQEKKKKVIGCHKSQLKFLDYIELAQIENAHRGKQLNREYCEVYEEVESERIYLNNESKNKVSLIIPAYNNEEYVSFTLKALMHQSCSFDDWEIVLVDDSEDERMLQFKEWQIPNLRIIEKEHSGRADTRNVGIQNSNGEILIFMDSDMIVDEHFVENHYDCHLKDDCDIALGKVNHIVNDYKDKVRQIVDANEINKLEDIITKDDYLNLTRIVFQNREAADYIGWVCCLFSNCSVKREVLEKSGVFDVDFVGWGLEDIELGYRFFKEKFKFSFFENIKNYHVDHVTDSSKMLVEMGKNLKRLYKKHPDEAIKSYMSFVAGFKDLQELLNDISNKNIEFDGGRNVYFKPLKYAKSKA